MIAAVFAVGFFGGYVGSVFGGSGTNSSVVVQQVLRDTEEVTSLSTSTGGVDLTLTQVSAIVSPSVVVITTEQMVASSTWYGGGSVESGAGSGVIISEDGYILTCQHVIDGASNVIVTIDDVDYVAEVIGEDAESDIAVIKINATGLTPAVLGDSDTLAVGEEVVAVGNPLGELGGTVTNGIVSALNRNIYVGDYEMTLIQTNASVSPGNSGGGLFNMAGELIGIVNAKSSDSDAEGLGFAIPVNTAYTIAQSLIENGYVTGRPELGITALTITDADTAAAYGVSAYGIYIYSVNDGSAAQKAGLQSGDRIISIEGIEVATLDNLTDTISDCEVGDTVTLIIARGGQMMSVEVTLGEKGSTSTSSTTEPEEETTTTPDTQTPSESQQSPSESQQQTPDTQSGGSFNPFG